MKAHYLQPGFKPCLGRFIEELHEAGLAAGKLLRFGPWSANPELPEDEREANIDALRREVADVIDAGTRLIEAIDAEPRQQIRPGMRAAP